MARKRQSWKSGLRDPNEIGVLWTKKTRQGDNYYSGTINGVRLVIFKDTQKQSEKSPDWRVLKQIPEEDIAAQRIQRSRARKRARLNAVAEAGRAATSFAPRLVKRDTVSDG
jgi:hypothetical protein